MLKQVPRDEPSNKADFEMIQRVDLSLERSVMTHLSVEIPGGLGRLLFAVVLQSAACIL